MGELALAYKDAGQLDRALSLFEKTLTQFKSTGGLDDPDTLVSMSNLAAGYLAAGKLDRALRLWEETLALQKSKLGAGHPSTFATMNNLGVAYGAAGDFERAPAIGGHVQAQEAYAWCRARGYSRHHGQPRSLLQAVR